VVGRKLKKLGLDPRRGVSNDRNTTVRSNIDKLNYQQNPGQFLNSKDGGELSEYHREFRGKQNEGKETLKFRGSS